MMSMCKLRVSAPGKVLTIDMPPDEAAAWFSCIAQALLGAGEVPSEEESFEPEDNYADELPLSDTDPVEPDPILDGLNPSDEETPPDEGDQPVRKSVKKVRGFLRIKCGTCGEIKTFCSRAPISQSICSACNSRTDLVGLHEMKAWCSSCESLWIYHTNIDSDMDEMSCLRCGAPITMERNRHGDYDTIGR